ncbi:type I-F CRISPR-associated endoribonuclease Cas6/Csy4 [Chitinibacter sp. FCG-7]|uniref:Type I-F CRISPR-associated endoribonuclease Cas6/Csy4 n=1 Tax=Chitinibacter mangrovi TaxID=3153927 RepID=A0AAU7FCX4_9NEIS
MDHYLEIKIIPDADVALSEAQLLSALYAKLHRALVDVGGGRIGVSFPRAGKTLGSVLRLHGSVDALGSLMNEPWLKGLRDYTDVSGILPVPVHTQHRVVRRVQVHSNPERLYRRSVRNGKLSAEEAEQKVTVAKSARSDLPYVYLRSNSNGNPFCLFIRQSDLQDSPVPGTFNHYGLSSTATIPFFNPIFLPSRQALILKGCNGWLEKGFWSKKMEKLFNNEEVVI